MHACRTTFQQHVHVTLSKQDYPESSILQPEPLKQTGSYVALSYISKRQLIQPKGFLVCVHNLILFPLLLSYFFL